MGDRIILLTECGSDIGFGHVARCTALAHAFREAGREVELWIAADDATRSRLPVGSRAIGWYDLPDESARELELAAAVVVDSYVATLSQIERVAQINRSIAVIDDWRRLPYRHGIVIDWTIGAEKFAYPQRFADVRYLVGGRYCTMRPEFGSAAERDFPETPRSVLVTFGGADVRRLTAPVLAMLHSEFPTLRLSVVVGAGVGDRSFMVTQRDGRTTFHEACTAGEMSELMGRADLAICAGGQTLYELASQGLPPVAVRVVDNQTDDLREFEAAGFAYLAGDWDSGDLLVKIADGVRALWSATARQRRSILGRQSVDGRGARRLALACLNHWSEVPALAR
jgi:UDP-2,4-diacetamido-2,4,6-trideoxy-beta-L-altropyranose hydrolase